MYEEYKLLLAAEQYTGAHFVAINALAPEAIIRDDLDLLNKLLQPFENVDISVDNWSSGGKVSGDLLICLITKLYLIAIT